MGHPESNGDTGDLWCEADPAGACRLDLGGRCYGRRARGVCRHVAKGDERYIDLARRKTEEGAKEGGRVKTGSSSRSDPCAYLGDPVVGPDGVQVLRACKSCNGTVRLKAFECRHPGHDQDPITTLKGCKTCRDYEVQVEGGWIEPPRDLGTMPVRMVVPSQRRPDIMRGGILQILVTRSCDLSCHGCSAGSNLVSKPAVMTPEQFEQAVLSLEGYPGVIGVFGGNPTTSRYFDDYCRILRANVPFEQRGIWTNRLLGKGKQVRITFDPAHSNLNTHLSEEAYYEFVRDWPESVPYLKGHDQDSEHGSPWVGMRDQAHLDFPDGTRRENTEENRWELIGGCPINKFWSAIICLVRGEPRGFACEIAGHMAALHAENPDWAGTGEPMADLGLKIEPGWWKRPLADFEPQFRTCCHNCSVPLNRPGQRAVTGEREEFSETHRFIARPKVRDRPVEFISVEALGRRDRPSTEYLDGITPGYHA